ncbi:CsbD family protein [Leptolyngbya sp. FACHB-261]|uniref:CsbD family protein n=1 Tax=Leptolyngbya sp. FACHB-261 TaxID=2692806 RepID=UPI001689F345|nr:CsbD family protein [Leptolyngbya sp. FACHB-261]MBD2101367.1 CsbD family protein [Leptolyngbya sp. FACHB-261]
MSAEDRAKAIAKNLEGKAQEAWGAISGNPEDRIEGQAKQAEAEAINTKENIKDRAKRAVDGVL